MKAHLHAQYQVHAQSSPQLELAASSSSIKASRFSMRLPKSPLSPNFVYNSSPLDQGGLVWQRARPSALDFKPDIHHAPNSAKTFARLWLDSQERDLPSHRAWKAMESQVCDSWFLSQRGLLPVGSFEILSVYLPVFQSSWLLQTRVFQLNDLPLFSGRSLLTLSADLNAVNYLPLVPQLLNSSCIQTLLELCAETESSYFRHRQPYVDVYGEPFDRELV